MKKVLVIDDDEIISEIIKIYLTNMGYHVDVAKDGKDGLTRFRKNGNFDVVITDVEMPLMNGIAVANLIRASEKSKTKLIAITGYSGFMLREELFDMVLPKPISLKRLASIIESIIRKKDY